MSSEQCPDESYCGSRFEVLNDDETPYQFNNPDLWIDTQIPELNYGITNFDNIGSAFLTIFVCTTMDAWTQIMAIHEDIFSQMFVIWYFILCIIICSFFILNLTIALMLMQYQKVQDCNS
jgi:hypothetical protein